MENQFHTQNRVTKTVLLICCGVSLAVGLGIGFLAGVAATDFGRDFLEGITTSERPALIDEPKLLRRPRFRLSYPENWRIAAAEADYDPDTNFSIDSPGSAYIIFLIGHGETDPAENVQHQVDAYRQLMPRLTTEQFSDFGRYSGAAVKMKGRMFGIPTTVCAYSFCREGLTFIVVEQCPNEDLQHVEPGFDLIRKSFRVEGAPEDSVPDDRQDASPALGQASSLFQRAGLSSARQ